ncbi:MAG TPA: adenylate/guanylate cyclase domain-containing protein [Gaiellaceae bacterium]|nr:adenylate/guanylate cyclase domain-containing protein [Gaiellaceae bacterium]
MERDTKYARSGQLWIAYQVVGDGPIDVLWAPGYMSHLEQNWTWPTYAELLNRLASFSRLIIFDRRGTGLSDRILTLGSFEEMLDDIAAVLDAAGSERAVLFGGAEGGPMCALYAATFPERTAALILGASYARRRWAPDYPWGISDEARIHILDAYETRWGVDESFGTQRVAPSLAADPRFRRWHAKACRFGGTPASARAWFDMTMQIDIRRILPTIRVPTLIIHRVDDAAVPVEAARYLAEHIPESQLVELPGADHYPFSGNSHDIIDEVEEFITGSRRSRELDRVLATVLFTDIVGSTERAAELGDARWRELLADHHRVVRTELDHARGKEVRLTGDGIFATFDGPARAVGCACAIRDAVRALGIEVRAGLHTGELELADSGPEGIAVHIGARIAALAEPSEVLTSTTVRDLVVGSGIEFADRGTHVLKGVPGEWHVQAVTSLRTA